MPDDAPTTDAPATDDAPTTDTPLGDAGQKALEAMKADLKAAKAEAREARTLRAELDQLRTAGQSETEKAIAAAKAEGISEALGKANDRVLRAEVRALAGGKLADPADAVRLLDLTEFSVGDDGDVPTKGIEKAIKALLEEKPYLAAPTGQRTTTVPTGARQGAAVDDMNARLRRAAGY